MAVTCHIVIPIKLPGLIHGSLALDAPDGAQGEATGAGVPLGSASVAEAGEAGAADGGSLSQNGFHDQERIERR
jgi:hypothetical protein